MDLWALIELIQTPYCERIGSGPFGEPLNAISNLAFVFAATLAARNMGRFPGLSRGARLLPWSLGLVAMGSILYHTYRSPITYLLDVAPLVVFMVASIYLALRKVLASSLQAMMAGAAFVFLQALLLIFVPHNFLNGSTPYLVPLSFIPPIMVWTAHRYGSLGKDLAAIAALFALAFLFRAIDRAACSWLPIGTHFLWHIAGGAASFALIRFVFQVEAADQASLLKLALE